MKRKMLTPLALGCAALLSVAACGGGESAADSAMVDTGMGAMPAPAPAPAPVADSAPRPDSIPTDTTADTTRDTTRRDTSAARPPGA